MLVLQRADNETGFENVLMAAGASRGTRACLRRECPAKPRRLPCMRLRGGRAVPTLLIRHTVKPRLRASFLDCLVPSKHVIALLGDCSACSCELASLHLLVALSCGGSRAVPPALPFARVTHVCRGNGSWSMPAWLPDAHVLWAGRRGSFVPCLNPHCYWIYFIHDRGGSWSLMSAGSSRGTRACLRRECPAKPRRPACMMLGGGKSSSHLVIRHTVKP